jgi:hypothetical protein
LNVGGDLCTGSSVEVKECVELYLEASYVCHHVVHRTAVTSYSYFHFNVICKIAGRLLQLLSIRMPTVCIYNYNGDRSDCNRWTGVAWL